MGILVAFWSPLHGRGTTSNCIASAMQFGYRYKNNVVITHTHYIRSTMETAFLKGNETEDLLTFSDLGIDSIERALQTGELRKEDFVSYCNKVSDNVYLLSGSQKANSELFNNSVGETFQNICRFSKKANSITFVDIESGFTKDIASRVLELADIVVVTLDQTNIFCEDFFNNQINHLDKEKVITMIGRYDWESKYSKKYIDKEFDQNVYVLPQLTEYLDALNNHRVNEFFRNYNFLEEEMFFDELNRLNDEIVERAKAIGVNFEPKELVTGNSNKSRFRLFRKRYA